MKNMFFGFSSQHFNIAGSAAMFTSSTDSRSKPVTAVRTIVYYSLFKKNVPYSHFSIPSFFLPVVTLLCLIMLN